MFSSRVQPVLLSRVVRNSSKEDPAILDGELVDHGEDPIDSPIGCTQRYKPSTNPPKTGIVLQLN